LAVTVSDISRILERVPVWRQLVTLPQRVSDLETRLAALTANEDVPPVVPMQTPARPSQYMCDSCFAPMNIIGEEKLDSLNVLGQAIHTLECSECARVTRKMFTPDDGYI